MPANSDRICGTIGLVITVTYFVYYMTWVLVIPLLESEVPETQKAWLRFFFPPREYAIAFMALLGYGICLVPCLYLGLVMCREYWRSPTRATPSISIHHYEQKQQQATKSSAKNR